MQFANGRLRTLPPWPITPDEAEGVLAPLYAHLPSIRITDLLADVGRWTGLTGCFTHLTTARSQATGAISPHKGSEPAVSFYTHVSDRDAPFHSRVISAGASEAAHVLDGLLLHGADLAIERHHTDGGGVSDHVFALCHLLAFRVAPRIPNIAARRLHLFADMRPGPDIVPLAAQPIDEALIADYWNDTIRLATSIRTDGTSAST